MSGGEGAAVAVALAENAAEAQYTNAKTSVWWDIENCHVPRGCDPFAIAQNINSALSKMNYCGPVTISSYGDTNRIPSAVQQALSSTGIALNHVPAGVKDASDKKILVDMLFWAVDNPAPANYLLISGDRDFSNALHQLRMRRYNILLAQPNKASAALVSAAKSVWLWTSLVAGGGPISKSESTSLVNGSNNFNAEAFQDHVPEPTHLYQSGVNHSDIPAVGNHKFVSPGKAGAGDPKYKGKHARKNLNQPSLIKSQSMPTVVQESKSYEYNHQPDYAQGRVYKKGPHEAFGPTDHAIPGSWSAPNIFQGNADHSATNSGMQDNQCLFPPRPRAFSMHSNPAPGNMIQPNAPNSFHPVPFRPDRPTLPSATFTSSPDIGKLSISSVNPNYVHSPMNVGQSLKEVSKLNPHENSNAGSRNLLHKIPDTHMNVPLYRSVSNRNPPEFSSTLSSLTPANTSSHSGVYGAAGCLPPPSEYELELLGLVLHALDCLKNEKISPSEANIADCICFGDLKNRNIDVKKALDVAIKRQMVMRHKLGDLQLYVNKGQKLWSCVNPIGGNPNQYPKATWEKIQKFLASSDGRSAIIGSSCKYEAALILKRSCLQDLPLGDVLRILNMLAGPKKWIKHNQSGWQPVTVILTEDSEEASNEAAS